MARDTTGLVLRAGRDGARPDTTAGTASDSLGRGWRVRWRGFRLGTDLGAFRALRAGRVPTGFTLLDGDGLVATRAEARVLGSPLAFAANGTTLVAQDSLARYAAEVLAAAPRGAPPPPDSVLSDTTLRPITPADREVTSAWARERLRGLIAGLGARDSLDDVLQGPYAYLNGWDGAYRAEGIAPSLFEWWIEAHRAFTGHLPDPADSLDAALLPSTLRIARAELRDRYGPLPTDWRWGRLQGGPRFPVLGGRRSAAARRFRNGYGAPGGHPTSLLPGPSVVFADAHPGRAVWAVRTDLRTGTMAFRPPSFRPLTAGGLDLDAGPDGPVLTLAPSAPMPAERLTLAPPS